MISIQLIIPMNTIYIITLSFTNTTSTGFQQDFSLWEGGFYGCGGCEVQGGLLWDGFCQLYSRLLLWCGFEHLLIYYFDWYLCAIPINLLSCYILHDIILSSNLWWWGTLKMSRHHLCMISCNLYYISRTNICSPFINIEQEHPYVVG